MIKYLRNYLVQQSCPYSFDILPIKSYLEIAGFNSITIDGAKIFRDIKLPDWITKQYDELPLELVGNYNLEKRRVDAVKNIKNFCRNSYKGLL